MRIVKMQSKVIREWLASFKSLTTEEVHSYASTIRDNEELTEALYKLFDSKPQIEVLDPVCHQLFEFYRSKETELQRFTLEFVPTLTWLYLNSLSRNDKKIVRDSTVGADRSLEMKSCGGVEVCLLGIYNLEIVHPDGSPKVKSFRIPSIGQPSVYHEPVTLSSLALTESTLTRFSKNEEDLWTSGPYPQYEAIISQNRQAVLTFLVQCYNMDIANMSRKSQRALCKSWSRVAVSGFSSLCNKEVVSSPSDSNHVAVGSHHYLHDHVDGARLIVSPSLLIEMLAGLYFVMFNSQPKLGIQTLEDIHNRACYELFADVQLVSNAIRNSLKYNPSGQPWDGPMGIAVALSPATSASTMSKSAITNASFRARKLPEDITVPEENEKNLHHKQLSSIEESSEGNVDRSSGGSGAMRSSGKLPKIGGGKKGEKSRTPRGKDKDETGSIGSGTKGMSTSLNGDSPDSSGAVGVSVIRHQAHTVVDSIELQPMPGSGGSDASPSGRRGDNQIQSASSGSGGCGIAITTKRLVESSSVPGEGGASLVKKSSSSSLSIKHRNDSLTAPLASLCDTEDLLPGRSPILSSSSNHIAISRTKEPKSSASSSSINRYSNSSLNSSSMNTDV